MFVQRLHGKAIHLRKEKSIRRGIVLGKAGQIDVKQFTGKL